MERARVATKAIFIVAVLAGQTFAIWTRAHGDAELAAVPLQGAYEVDSLIRDGVEVPPLLTDATRTRYFILRAFDDNRFVQFRAISGERKFYNARIDAEKKTITLEGPPKGEEKPPSFTLHYAETDDNKVTFEGMFEGANIQMALHKLQADNFLLMNRGFHWVSEVPFNR
jgi:hypothetical protein